MTAVIVFSLIKEILILIFSAGAEVVCVADFSEECTASIFRA
jgi:hypothetical protein